MAGRAAKRAISFGQVDLVGLRQGMAGAEPITVGYIRYQ